MRSCAVLLFTATACSTSPWPEWREVGGSRPADAGGRTAIMARYDAGSVPDASLDSGVVVTSTSAPSKLAVDARAQIAQLLSDRRAPGASFAVRDAIGVTLMVRDGYADAEAQRQLTAKDLFRI